MISLYLSKSVLLPLVLHLSRFLPRSFAIITSKLVRSSTSRWRQHPRGIALSSSTAMSPVSPSSESRQPQFSGKFPQEIHLIIISQFDDTPTLAALSLVSRAFHEPVEPYLYLELKTLHQDSLPLALRTILTKPQLGRYVKSCKCFVTLILRMTANYLFHRGIGTASGDDEDLNFSVFDPEEISRLFSAAS